MRRADPDQIVFIQCDQGIVDCLCVVEMVRARTVELWLAVERLRDASRAACRAKEGT